MSEIDLANGESLTVGSMGRAKRHDINIDTGELAVEINGVNKGTLGTEKAHNFYFSGVFQLVATGAVVGTIRSV